MAFFGAGRLQRAPRRAGAVEPQPRQRPMAMTTGAGAGLARRVPHPRHAGNFTILGSIANIIVAHRARRHGIEIGFCTYFKIGAPLGLVMIG